MPRPESDKRVTRSSRQKPYQMTDVENKNQEVFLTTGRTGRRNALADILDEKYAGVSTASLPSTLSGLTCDDDIKSDEPKENNEETSTSVSAPSTVMDEKDGTSTESQQCSKAKESNSTKSDSKSGKSSDNAKCDKTEQKSKEESR